MIRTFTVLCCAAVSLFSIHAMAANDLPRRGTLGLALAANPGGEGLKINEVLNKEAQGIQKDDVLLAVNGKPVTGPQGVAPSQQIYGVKAGTPVILTIKRGSASFEVSVVLVPAPPPALEGKPIELGTAQAKGGPRVRTYLMEPSDKSLARKGKLPAVMILPGIPCGTVESFSNAGHPYSKLFKGFTEAGLISYMAEKPGQGDSEGVNCLDGGFDAEEQAFRAAALKLLADSRVDPKRFFVIGLSLGGIQAPLVAESAPAAGIVTWGTGVSPWYDYLLTTFHRRAILQGEDPAAVQLQFQAWRRVLNAVYVTGLSPADIKTRMPDDVKAAGELAAGLEQFAGRSWAFHREIDRAPVVRAWNVHKGKLLALHGEFDWVAEKHDHSLAADIVNRTRPGDGIFEIVPGNDHGFSKHKTQAESFAKFGQGEPDDTFFKRSVAWIAAEAKR